MNLKNVVLLTVLLFAAISAQSIVDTTKADTTKPVSQKDLIPVSDTVKIPVLDFKNTDIRDILRGLGMQYGLNIYLDPDVKGNISLYLVQIPLKDAIDFIVKRKNFDYKVENSIVKVFVPKKKAPPPPPKPKVTFSVKNGLISTDFRDVTADDVGRMFIDSANINVVLEGGGDKKISSKLSKIPLEKAIKIIYETNGFDVSNSEGIYYISKQYVGESGSSSGGMQRSSRLNLKITDNKYVSLEVTNASIDNIVRNIILESGLSIMAYEKIQGTITTKCDSIYIDDMLRFLLQNTKYTFWKDKNIYFIGSKEMSLQKTTEVIPLKHIMAEEKTVGKTLPPKITKEATIKYDTEHNSVIVTGSFDVVERTREFIDKIDKPIPQVLIEALVVEFNVSKIRSYGLSLFTQALGDTSGDWQSEQFLPNLNLKPGAQRITKALNNVLNHLGSSKVVKLPANFRASLQALESADVVKVHSTPQVATINGNAASITIGETRYYKLSKETISTTANTSSNVIGTDERFESKKFNTVLELTPWVMSDGYVMVDIRPEFNIPRSGGDADRPPTIDTRVIKSMVRLKDGHTIVLGGQRQTEEVVNSKGIPFLSNIPILGFLFSSKTLTKNETQMMVFVTPHVYYGGDEGFVEPDDYFGDEINAIMDKADPEKARAARKEKREKRKTERENEKSPGSYGS